MGTQTNYWDGVLRARISRRRALLGSTGLGLGLVSASLLGCGDDDDSGSTGSSSSSGLVSTPVDTTSKAVKGGVITSSMARDHDSFDMDSSLSGHQRNKLAYSRLVKIKAYKHPESSQGLVEGDAAGSWEVSPNNLKVTYKLRPGLKFDPAAPTSGRPVTSDDVLFSWERYKRLSRYASTYSAEVAPTAPWVKLTAPDKSTVVIDLAYPYAPHDIMTAYYASLPIYPAEADGGFDPKTQPRGSAAWRLKEWLPSARLEFEKNPSYYDAGGINIDGINFILISEYATRLSQFRAGSLMNFGGQTFGSGAAPEDILSILKDQSNVKLYVDEDFDRGGNPIKFADIPNSMFADLRIRQAMSMLIDRDLLIETMYNPGPLVAAGLPVELRWDTGIPAGEEWWLDPKSSEFGDSAKNLMYNPGEAKKLLAAAGIKAPITSTFWVSNGYPGSEYERENAIIQGMLEATGDFKLPIKVLDHNTDFRNNVIFNRTLNGQDVIAYVGGSSTEPDVDIWFDRWYGRVAPQGEWPLDDEKMNGFVTQQRQALDRDKRASIVKDFQRYQASKLHNIWAGGSSSSFLLIHDFIGNGGLWRAKGGGSPQNETWTHLWLDKSKM